MSKIDQLIRRRHGARLNLAAERFARLWPALAICWSVFWTAYAQAATQVSAVRVWPAIEYTRIALEARDALQYRWFTLQNPDRLVVDLDGVELDATLQGVATKIAADDPYVKLARAARFKPGVVRLVLDLKSDVKPNVFLLPPVAGYGHRLVLDVYPAIPVDPLLALLKRHQVEVDTAPTEPVAADTKVADANAEPAASRGVPEKRSQEVKVAKLAPRPERLVTIAIDAGHGGEDPGAQGARGTEEKEVTLSIARLLKETIDAEPGLRGALVRDGDYFIPLHQRVNKARRLQADLFVSIHADAFMRREARGSSVFALSERGATSAAARWLANQENAADLIGGVNLNAKDPYLARTLLDLSQTATINDSLKLARAVLGELGGMNPLHRRQVEQAGFAVLKAPDLPSILIETAFISNPDEERKLTDVTYQQKIAAAIAAGIKRYLAKHPPLTKIKVAQTKGNAALAPGGRL